LNFITLAWFKKLTFTTNKSMTQLTTVFLCLFCPVKKAIYLSLAVFGMLFSSPLFSQNNNEMGWTQFRGNQGDGMARNVELISAWPETGPEKLWSKNVGNGFSEVTVASGIAYIFSSDSLDGGYEYLAAFDAETGKDLWKTRIDSLYFEVDGWGHGPRSTPATDGDMIYCLSGRGKLAALSTRDGKEFWSKFLPEDFGAVQPRWGFSASPFLLDDLLIMETGGAKDSTYTAFNKNTGAIVWSKGVGGPFYSSPAISKIDNQIQIVFPKDTMLCSYNRDGNLLWSYRMPLQSPTAQPVFMAADKFFVSSLSDTGSFLIQVNNNQVKKLWSSAAMQNEWSSSIYHEGYFYGFSKGKLVCISAENGAMKWGQRGFGKGSLILVGDKLLILSDQGVVTLVETFPEKFVKLASFKAMEGKSWTAPSFAEGKLFVRNLSEMSVYKLTK